jgi:hypothetical protein
MTKPRNHRVNRSKLSPLTPSFMDYVQPPIPKDGPIHALLKSQESRIIGQQRVIHFLQRTIDCLTDEIVETRRSLRFIKNTTRLLPTEKN